MELDSGCTRTGSVRVWWRQAVGDVARVSMIYDADSTDTAVSLPGGGADQLLGRGHVRFDPPQPLAAAAGMVPQYGEAIEAAKAELDGALARRRAGSEHRAAHDAFFAMRH